jgi:hypothetical protein
MQCRGERIKLCVCVCERERERERQIMTLLGVYNTTQRWGRGVRVGFDFVLFFDSSKICRDELTDRKGEKTATKVFA